MPTDEGEGLMALRANIEKLRSLIGPLDAPCAQARAETIDAILAMLGSPPSASGGRDGVATTAGSSRLALRSATKDTGDAGLREAAGDVMREATLVMQYIGERGPSIVPHLIDTDDNPGQRLRDALPVLRAALSTPKPDPDLRQRILAAVSSVNDEDHLLDNNVTLIVDRVMAVLESGLDREGT